MIPNPTKPRIIIPRPKPWPQLKPQRLPERKRMTIAAGMFFDGGVAFGADTEEGVGEMKRRVHKIPKHPTQPAMITGSCCNGHLMDTAIERIFDAINSGIPQDFEAVGAQLSAIMGGLYNKEFSIYPNQDSIPMKLLVAMKPPRESKVGSWSIDCNVVRRMTAPHEIVGVGILSQFVADQLHCGTESLETVKLAMVQLLSVAKSRVQGVGGESYVHWLRDNGTWGGQNFRFFSEQEDLCEFFLAHGRDLLLCTGTEATTNERFDAVAAKFIADLKWKRSRIFPAKELRPSKE